MMDYGKLIGAIIGSVNAIKNIGMGAKQVKDGKKLQAKLDAQGRPIVETPEAFNEIEGIVRSNYLDPRLMGETRIKDAIKARESNQIQNIQQTAGSGVDALLAYNMANANTDNSLFNVDMKAYEQQQNDYNKLLGILGQKADYQQSQFDFNVLQPFMQNAEKAKALINAGQQNVNNGMNDWAGYAMNSMGDSGNKPGKNAFETGNVNSENANANQENMNKAMANMNFNSADMQNIGGVTKNSLSDVASSAGKGETGVTPVLDSGQISQLVKLIIGNGKGVPGNTATSGGIKF